VQEKTHHSVEVAWCLAVAAVKSSMRQLVYLEERSLKGVWDGREYPIFAVGRRFDDRVNRALRSSVHPRLTTREIRKICRACVESFGWPSAIYLPNSSKRYFRTMPEVTARYVREDSTRSPLSGREEMAVDGLGAPLPGAVPIGDDITAPQLN